VLSAGRQPSLRSLFNHYSGLSRLSRRVPALEGINMIQGIHDDRPREVEWLAGACMLVKREVIETVGPFTERWFMYAEDMEWCSRIRAAGWTVWHLPDAVIVHHVGASQARKAVGTTVWLEAARGHYHTLSAPSPARRVLFDTVALGGLASRAAIYASLAAVQPRHRRQWAAESRTYGMYCRSYVRFLRGAH
jgi:GT2 family glycosyltransferase